MPTIEFHVLLFICISLLTSYSATAQPLAMTKPGCDESCGDVSIPFPFGMTESCAYNSNFQVDCNETSGTGSKLLFGGTDVEIKSISLDKGQLSMMLYIAKRCYAPNGNLIVDRRSRFWLQSIYRMNNTANKFTVVGCDSYGYISGQRWSNRSFSTGCIATCNGLNDMEEGSCMGMGCCQTSEVPKDIRAVNMSAGSFNNHRNVTRFNNCTYGFITESTYRFSPNDLTNLMNVEKLPAVVDWVIGKERCDSAQNSPGYACKGEYSECLESARGEGYRCKCKMGYEGNPYLSDDRGCRDKDECKAKEALCEHECLNTPGNFTCLCPKSYVVDENDKLKCICPKGYHNTKQELHDGSCIRELPIYIPITGAALGVIVVLLFSCLVHLVLKRKRSKNIKHMNFLRNGGMLLKEKLTDSEQMSMSMEREMSSRSDAAQIFSSAELERASNNFHSSMIVGQGGFGTVYKGLLDDHRIVAIKKSKEVDPTQIDQFINEVVVLSRVSHRNIVKLLGCCLETPVPHLVYEFVNNGTLYEHIHDPAKKRFINWNVRLKIATETAEVLSYLHSAAATPIIHRDVKSANILLDHNFEAKVSDFGASRLVPIDQTQLSTMVQGTFGYLDPEYMQTNQLTEKSDVYSFGVVLLELLMGVKALSYDRPEEERSLTNFFLSKLKQGRLFEVLDETIVCENVNLEQVTEVAKLAQVCIHLKGQDRPSMKQVAMELEGLRTSAKSKHSWIEFDENVEEMEPVRSNLLDDYGNGEGYSTNLLEDYGNGEGYSTSVGFDSVRDEIKLSGGR